MSPKKQTAQSRDTVTDQNERGVYFRARVLQAETLDQNTNDGLKSEAATCSPLLPIPVDRDVTHMPHIHISNRQTCNSGLAFYGFALYVLSFFMFSTFGGD